MSVCVNIHGRPADGREDYGDSRMETGMVFVNYPDVSAPDLPFGGIKCSGYGKELSSLDIEEFVNKKLILVPNVSS